MKTLTCNHAEELLLFHKFRERNELKTQIVILHSINDDDILDGNDVNTGDNDEKYYNDNLVDSQDHTFPWFG